MKPTDGIYGRWAGLPHGVREEPSLCVEEVYSDRIHRGMIGFQCSRKRGHGPGGAYCKQHAKLAEARAARRRELTHD